MRRLFTLAVGAVWLTLSALPASAHPLGNYTTNVHVGIHIDGDQTSVQLVVDMAEIPTFGESLDRDDDNAISKAALAEYADTSCEALGGDIVLDTDTGAIDLRSSTQSAEMNSGQSDLDTLRLECGYTATLDSTTEVIEVSNRVYEDRIGWAEIVVTGASAPEVPSTSPSGILTAYPDGTPLNERTATVHRSGGAAATQVAAPPTQSGGFLVNRLGATLEQVGSTGGLIAIAAAIALGAVHALAPGHGKTLMAAYLVGRDGTRKQAAGLGLAVAVSHTLGVAVLGLVTATASTQFRPEAVYPWLTTGSASIVTGLGLVMLFRAVRGRRSHTHDHGHSHGPGADHHHEPPADLGWRSLAALGLAGGLVPSASAVVLLLGALAIGRPWFGVGLVFAFGAGMSLALVAAGLIALKLTRTGLDRLSRTWKVPERLVPGLAGTAVTAVGAVLLWDAVRTLV